MPQSTLQFFFPIIFYHLPPIFLDLESICFDAPTSLSSTFIDDGKYVLSNNLHMMGGICKKLWLWDFLINFSFGCLQKLTPVTYQSMLENSSHCAIVVTDDEVNYENRSQRASSTIFNIAEASILFKLPLKLSGHSCSSASSLLFFAASHFQQAFE